MTSTHDLTGVACQAGDCGNAAALTVTVELPTSWTEEREYTTRTLQVAVCGECAPLLEADARALLEARVRFTRGLDLAETASRLRAELVALIEAVGPPFELVQGGVFARWLADLDQVAAQGAWRLLAHTKRTREAGRPRPQGRRFRASCHRGGLTPRSARRFWCGRPNGRVEVAMTLPDHPGKPTPLLRVLGMEPTTRRPERRPTPIEPAATSTLREAGEVGR
jgi:hypothetical protein